MFKSVDLFYEPREQSPKDNGWPKGEPEMTSFESAFLCGLIKSKKPHKIVEIGVAGGGTTFIVLKCLELLGLEGSCQVYSMDLSELFYRGNGEQSGYLANEQLTRKDISFNHQFVLGKYLPEVLDEIGPDIDFVILDTEHSLPGELLDFLAIYPYLASNACVVVHDIILNHIGKNHEAFATQLLLSAVVADKYLAPDTERMYGYPNIAAFEINEQTRSNIQNVFLSLLITWKKGKTDYIFELYKNHYKRFYNGELIKLFEQSFYIQKETQKRKKQEQPALIRKMIASYISRIPRKIYKKLF